MVLAKLMELGQVQLFVLCFSLTNIAWELTITFPIPFVVPLATWLIVLQVTMVRSEDALLAIRDPNPCIDGRKANVNLAVLGAKPRLIPGGEWPYMQMITF